MKITEQSSQWDVVGKILYNTRDFCLKNYTISWFFTEISLDAAEKDVCVIKVQISFALGKLSKMKCLASSLVSSLRCI